MQPRAILGWLLVLLLALFVGFNWTSVQVRFFGLRATMPVAFVAILSALLGAGAAVALRMLSRRGGGPRR